MNADRRFFHMAQRRPCGMTAMNTAVTAYGYRKQALLAAAENELIRQPFGLPLSPKGKTQQCKASPLGKLSASFDAD